MGTKLAGALPQGESNGLAAISRELVELPDKVHVVIALVDCSKITHKVDDGDVIPTARIRRIEAISDAEDGLVLRRILLRQYERRTGKEVLPFALEEDLRSAFGDPEAEDAEKP